MARCSQTMRTNRKDVGHTYNSVTGCTPGKGTSGCSEAGCHTNVCSCIRSRDAVEMYWSGMHLPTHYTHLVLPRGSTRWVERDVIRMHVLVLRKHSTRGSVSIKFKPRWWCDRGVSGAGCHTNVCTGTEEAQYTWVSFNKIQTKVVVWSCLDMHGKQRWQSKSGNNSCTIVWLPIL